MKFMKRKPLSRRIPRDFKANFGKYLGMILILVCTISIGSSFQTTLDGAVRYLEDIKEENLQEDGFFESYEKITSEDFENMQEFDVEVYENFYATENSFIDDSKVLVFDERTDVDLPVVFEGRLPKDSNEIALDHVFARGKNIKIGESVNLCDKDFIVVGTVSLPDYSSLFLNNTDLMMNTSHFCVSVVSHEAFETIDGGKVTYRYSYRYNNRELNKPDKLEKSDKMLKTLGANGVLLQNFLRSDQNQAITFLEMDIGTDGPFMTVFVYMLVAVIAFVFAILTNNTIERESVIIGTLLASGYTKKEIIWHYLQPTFIVAVLGSAIGNLLGYTVMIKPFLDVYYNTYSIGPLNTEFSYTAFTMTTVLPVIIMIGINYLMLRKKLNLSPLKFLRHDLKTGKQKIARKLPNISFLNRFRLRVIMQNRGSYIMLFIGIFIASFLLMFGIGLKPLMNHYTDSIDESLPYDYQYILKAPVDVKGGEKVKMYEMDTWFKLGGKDIGITLMGIDEDSEIFKGSLSDDKETVSVSSALSKKLGIKSGDKLKLTDSNTDKEYELKIGKVTEYEASLCVFMERSKLNDMLESDADSYNSLISTEELDIEDKYIAKQIARSDLLGAANQMMDSFATVILFVNIFSVAVYMILMYILTKVVLDKNALSISFMKVFGYKRSEIRKVYLTATTFIVILSLIICIPVEIEMFKLVLVFLSSMIEGYIEFYLPAYVYVEIIVIGIIAYFAINAVHIRSVEKIPMTDALKNRE